MTISKLLFVLCSVLYPILGIAGPITSGGGNAVVCRDSQGKILSAELLDLYEARLRFQLALAPASGSMEADFLSSRERIMRQFADWTSPFELEYYRRWALRDLESFLRPVAFTAPLEKLPLLGDQGEMLPPPPGCALEQVAIFGYAKGDGDWDVFRVNREIFDAFDSLNQAALASHELNHRAARRFGEPNSELTRAYIGYEFTSTPLPKVYAGIPKIFYPPTPPKYYAGIDVDYECHANTPVTPGYQLSFMVFPSPTGKGKRLQFTEFGSRLVNTQTYIDLPEVNWELVPTERTYYSPVVAEKAMALVKRVSLESVQKFGLELEVSYITGEPVRFRVFHKGNLVRNVELGMCVDRRTK